MEGRSPSKEPLYLSEQGGMEGRSPSKEPLYLSEQGGMEGRSPSKEPLYLSEQDGMEGRSPSKESSFGVFQVAKPPGRHQKTKNDPHAECFEIPFRRF